MAKDSSTELFFCGLVVCYFSPFLQSHTTVLALFHLISSVLWFPMDGALLLGQGSHNLILVFVEKAQML